MPITARADYRVEFDGSYAQTKPGDLQGLGDVDEIDLSVAVFLRPVKDASGPRGEAEFLSRASSLRYSFSRDKLERPNFAGAPISDDFLDTTPQAHGARIRYVTPDSGWIFSLAGNRPESFNTEFVTNSGWSASGGVGRYLSQSASIELTVGYTSADFGVFQSLDCPLFLQAFGCERIEIENESETTTTSVSARYRRVGKIGQQTFATSLQVGYSNIDFEVENSGANVIGDIGESDGLLIDGVFAPAEPTRQSFTINDNWSALLAGTWYPMRELGLDAGLFLNSSDGSESFGFDAGLGWFLTPNLELRGNYRHTFLNDFDEGPRLWRATLRTRF